MSRLRGKTWTADVRKFGGGRVAGFKSRAAADRYEAECAVAHERGDFLPLPALDTGAPTPWTLGKALHEVSTNQWVNLRHSRFTNEGSVLRFAETLQNGLNTPLASITRGAIDSWGFKMQREGASPATINRNLSPLSGTFAYAKQERRIAETPVIGWWKVEGTGRVLVLDHAQEGYFLERGLRGIDRTFAKFLLATGMRRGEAAAFRVADVIWLNGEPRAVKLLAQDTKSGKERTVPLTTIAREIVRNLVELAVTPDCPVFGSVDTTRFTEAWRRLRLESPWASDSDLTPHALRHTCITRLLLDGVNPVIVQRWMGHASLEQTMAYFHESTLDFMAAVNKLESR